jgi:hypothetical protein
VHRDAPKAFSARRWTREPGYWLFVVGSVVAESALAGVAAFVSAVVAGTSRPRPSISR